MIKTVSNTVSKTVLGLLLLGAIIIPGLGEETPAKTTSTLSVADIIRKNLESRGGADLLRSLRSTRMTGTMIMNKFEMPFTMWHKKPNMVRYNFDFTGKVFTFGYDGQTPWQLNPFDAEARPQQLIGPQAENVKDNAELINHPFLDHQKKGNDIRLEGREELQGTPVFKLKITRPNGKIVYYFLDAESCIELKQTVSRKRSDGTHLKIETLFSDYKPVAGIMFPHSLNLQYNDCDFGHIIVSEIKTDLQLEDAFFKMPTGNEDGTTDQTGDSKKQAE